MPTIHDQLTKITKAMKTRKLSLAKQKRTKRITKNCQQLIIIVFIFLRHYTYTSTLIGEERFAFINCKKGKIIGMIFIFVKSRQNESAAY